MKVRRRRKATEEEPSRNPKRARVTAPVPVHPDFRPEQDRIYPVKKAAPRSVWIDVGGYDVQLYRSRGEYEVIE